jgi:hypothetical protein
MSESDLHRELQDNLRRATELFPLLTNEQRKNIFLLCTIVSAYIRIARWRLLGGLRRYTDIPTRMAWLLPLVRGLPLHNYSTDYFIRRYQLHMRVLFHLPMAEALRLTTDDVIDFIVDHDEIGRII